MKANRATRGNIRSVAKEYNVDVVIKRGYYGEVIFDIAGKKTNVNEFKEYLDSIRPIGIRYTYITRRFRFIDTIIDKLSDLL